MITERHRKQLADARAARRLKRRPLVERFWARVNKGGQNGCWEWTGSIEVNGYGVLFHEGKHRKAHRFSWELANGAVPSDLCLDHLCRNRRCVNPEHLEAVTTRVNILRGVSCVAEQAKAVMCKNGHEYTDQNTRMTKRGRLCRACERDRERRWLKKQQYEAQKGTEGNR